ncbi:MAG: T9SS type A sorting domain-containing protein [Ignavibacteriales bacterium]|nr:T9SS type A sorting domain-containing protein [Ignavibacteriales bacterium]
MIWQFPPIRFYIHSNNSLYASNLACDTINTVTSFFTSVADLEILPNGDMWVCASRNLLFSSDHGQSWVTRFTLTSGDFYKIRMFADGTGYVIDGSIYKTTDHGNTWTKLGFNPYSIFDFDFYDRNNGFVIGSYGKIHRTRDGGIYFEQLNLAGMTNTNAVFCLDSLNIFISGTKVYSTYDGGMIWKENLFEGIPAGPGNMAALHMFDHSNGIYVGQHAPIWRTYNRGNTPVELSSFSAVSLGNKVALQWTTETETNNMGFEIERRYKHSDWKTITFSKGSGTSTRKIYYGYDDYEPKAPCILYYRLKQIDYNGTFEYSKEVEVIFGEVPEDYAIQQNYPNPFNPSTKINFSLPEENKVVIRVFNPMGELVQEINRGTLSHGYFEQDIEMGSNPSGMYFCQVLCTNTKTERTKSLTIKMVLMK